MIRPLLNARAIPRFRRCLHTSILLRSSANASINAAAVAGLHENYPILKHVQRRVQERKELQSQLTEDFSSAEDVARARKISELEPLQSAWEKWQHVNESLREMQPLLHDADPAMRSLAVEEYATLNDTLSELAESTFPALLIPPSSTSHLSALIELRAGAGGSEASLFLAEMVRMYSRVATASGWKAQIMSASETDNGGMKDAIMEVKGKGVYDALRWESGVHRVQRVPATEASGRTHTSTVAVVVLPLSEEDASTGEDELFSMDDVRIEVMRARGAGGQHVNKTESAVRLTHIPTGITVAMQDERSQHQNKRRAFQVLRARLMDRKMAQDVIDRRTVRRNLVKNADRSEKIRTYNFAQDRVTDHRIGLSLMNVSSVMEGEALVDFLQALQERHRHDLLEDILVE